VTPLTITWVYFADDTRSSLRLGVDEDDGFVGELARYAGVEIPLVKGRLCDVAPDDGFILWNVHGLDAAYGLEECGDRAAEIASRLVTIDASTSRIFRALEHLHIAAAIDSFSHLAWKEGDSAKGLYGRRDIAAQIGATCDEKEASENYGYLTRVAPGGLPQLLADYLVALTQTR
jgi:hypothetical protein